MAMFPTHIKCSTLAGIGGGAVAYLGYGVPLTTSIVGAGLCSVGGILPDIDSGPGIPLREITTFLASVVPTMLITRLLSYSFTQESLILAGGRHLRGHSLWAVAFSPALHGPSRHVP